MKPLVSIVIPVFNKADYLTRALDSALGQTYGNVEVVAVDDGSTDASPAILEAAAAANPSLRVHTQENAGLSSARNTGIAGARGDYLMFHDADDVLELDAVENLLEIALAHGSDVVGGVFRRHVNGRSFPVRAFRHNDLRLNFRSMPALAERYCTNFSSCNKLFRTAFLRDAGLEFTPGLYMQDIEFWLKAMFLSDNISQTRHVVSNYHFYPDSSSRSRSAARFESVFTLFERTESFYREHGLEDFLKVRNLAFVQGALMFFVRWKLGEWTRSEDTTDLDRMRALLTLVPAEDFVSYLHRSRGPNAAMLLLVREGDYAEAERIRTSPYTRELAWRRGFGPLDTPEQVMALARRIGRSRLRNAAYSVYYASEYFLHNPRQLVNAGRNAARKGAGRVTRMLVPAATVLRPLVSALRDVTRIVLQPHESEVPRYRTVRRLRRLSFLLLGPLGPRLAEAEKRSAARHALERARARSAGITGKHFLVFGLGDLYRIGGVQLSYRRLFEHLCAQGHIVTFYSHRDRPEGSKPYYPFPDQVEIAHYRLADTPASWQGIASIAEHHDPDCILIVNSGQPSLILAAALYDLPYPVVYSERGASDYTLEHNWCSQTQRELVHFATDMAHVLMPSYVRSAPTFLRGEIRVIPSVTEPGTGIATVDRPNPKGRYTLLYTGRFSFEKDLDILLRAFAAVADGFPDWDLRFVGEGPEQGALQAITRERGLEGRVFFPGPVSDLDAVFATYLEAHLFVLPSRAEGCPLALREAMAHGLPVIGFASCTGTNEIIHPGRNGILVDDVDGDKVGGLAAALETLMADPDLRKRYGERGIRDVEIYAPDVIHAAWENLLLDAAELKGRRSQARAVRRDSAEVEYDVLDETLSAVRQQGLSRNIVAYDGKMRRGTAGIRLVSNYLLLFGSCLFDRLYYYSTHLEVKLAGIDPLEHYLTEGWLLGYRPREDFDPERYREQFLGESEPQCPLVHFYRNCRWSGTADSLPVSAETLRALEAEELVDPEDLVDPQDIAADKVAAALRRRLEWRPFSRAEIELLTARPVAGGPPATIAQGLAVRGEGKREAT